MKKPLPRNGSTVFASLFTFFALSIGVFAAERSKNHLHKSSAETASTHESSASTTSTNAESHSDSSSILKKTGFGLAAVQRVTFTPTSLTGWMTLSETDGVQIFAGVGSTSPAFQFGLGGLLKHSFIVDHSNGIHVGGGFGIGNSLTGANATSFAFGLHAVAGLHFSLPGSSHFVAHLDGGSSFMMVSTSPSSTSDFMVGALSPALGLSVVYMVR